MSDSDPDDAVDRSRLPDAWTVWSRGEDGRLVLAYRPDVFDGAAFPAPCLPTLYLTHGKRTRRPGINPADTADSADWFVTLYLEPDVSLDETLRFPTREAALERAIALARAFDAGDVDYRELYQVPREEYFERLDELTGDDTDD
ncbi:DUF5820 family protein [Natrinema sp. 1APR25-10V2]|uniref:DUF5820 family protein n=1 Tax=Natrinema sp. 1APR25-10V2 TaxID=2951081 RepID=UPI002876CC66|nr:DUF5820 family protein [Natrinema sp. 1APR25-10V2]MDS0477473.1 DUF5820 family protein [Natrinema sp. 1APR25-10V2]